MSITPVYQDWTICSNLLNRGYMQTHERTWLIDRGNPITDRILTAPELTKMSTGKQLLQQERRWTTTSVDLELIERMVRLLQYSNYKNQRTVIEEVLTHGGSTAERIQVFWPDFGDAIYQLRNQAVHPNTPETEEFYWRFVAVTTGMQWILRHAWLLNLGSQKQRLRPFSGHVLNIKGTCSG